MKAFAIILALLVFTLSVSPCCATDNCADEVANTEQKDTRSDDSGLCSPFYTCAACLGFTLPGLAYEPSILLIPTLNYPAGVKLGVFSQFPPSIWQPPKVG
ncbi:DUF6660 family protein [Rufibacter latericius]|uniref:DUF6660 family protein n=1 Tax=Rufibacter latericius TaxID=2487040 RepID=UPI00267AE1D9|nr:DUF6660 family protein [Rufibacter latericius]